MIMVLACGVAWFGGGVSSPGASPSGTTASSAAAEAEYQQSIRPFLQKYCYDCHGTEKQKADLSLERFNQEASLHPERQIWEEVLRRLRNREMPPESRPQPEDAERDRVATWLDNRLFPIDCEKPDPGRVTIRRLNRAEYNNTIRDLLGVELRLADDFPADDSGYGFDNIGDALSLSPLLLEKYLAAAEKALDAAIADPESRAPVPKRYSPPDFKKRGGGSLVDSDAFSLYSQGDVFIDHVVKNPGEYRVRVQAYGQQAGPEPVKMSVQAGNTTRNFEVRELESAPGQHELTINLPSGRQRVRAAFLNDYYNEQDPNPSNRDRNLIIQSIEITGPLDPPQAPLSESHRKLLRSPLPPASSTNDHARAILQNFARRAFRRLATDHDVTRLMRIFQSVHESGASFERSLKVAFQAVMVSPHFLFRGELQSDPNNPQKLAPVDDFALASRLSYFIWSSMPDEELFTLAAQGMLRQSLRQTVSRMVRDPKAQAFVDNFGGQWLQTRLLKQVAPDRGVFASFDDDLRSAMARETELFFAGIVFEDRSVLEFLNADYTYVNDRLARHYGLADVTGSEFRRVSTRGTARGGVLTHASVLTLTSNPTRTSPVKRGLWVLENLLAQAPPPPPPGIPPLGETKEASSAASLRQRMEQHRSDPMCSSCHSIMDPIGFGLESFDGIGAWRDKDGEFPVDASGKLNTGEQFAGATQLKQILATQKRDEFVRCLAEKVLTYALGRGLEHYDRCALDRITQSLRQNDFKFSALIMGVVESVPFQMRRGEGDRHAAHE